MIDFNISSAEEINGVTSLPTHKAMLIGQRNRHDPTSTKDRLVGLRQRGLTKLAHTKGTPMPSAPLAPWRCAMFALVALAGCTSTASSDQGNGAATTVALSTPQPAGGSPSGDAYPDWAAAIAPAYTSNVTSAGGTKDQFYQVYQINTADSYETVLAWYEAHVKTTWPHRHSDQTAGKVGNIVITLQKDGDPSPSNKTRTMIGFVKKS